MKTTKLFMSIFLTLIMILNLTIVNVCAISIDDTYIEAEDNVIVKEQEFIPTAASGCPKGIGGIGYEGDATWRMWINNMQTCGGTVSLVGGVVPTRSEAFRLINAVKGIFLREEIHSPGGVSTHTYWHMHYKYNGYENALQFRNN